MQIIPRHSPSWVRPAGIIIGVLVFALADEASHLPLGFQLLALPQLWKFQRIVHLVGLGFVAVFTVGGHIDNWVVAGLRRLDKWFLRGGHKASFILVVMILAYTLIYGGVTFYRHYSFNSCGYDLAIQDQVVWNTAQGRPFESSIEVSNYLGDHFQPYLALLSLVYVVVPSPYVLLAFQTLVLASSAWPLYRLASRKFNSPAVGLALTFCGLAYPPLGFLNRFDFHGEIIAVPLLIAAYERLDVRDYKRAAVFMGLALFAKEEMGLTVAALGLMIAFCHRQWRVGLTWTFAGVACSLIALFVIIPAFRGGPSDTLARYQWLGHTPVGMMMTMVSHPGFILRNVIEARRIVTFLQLIAPLAFFSLLGVSSLLVAVPALAYNYLTHNACQVTIYCHYMTPVIPFTVISGVVGLHWLTTSRRGGRLLARVLPRIRSGQGVGLGLGMVLLATLTSWPYESPITDSSMVSSALLVQPNSAAIRNGLAHVSDDVYLVTTNAYAPHLSHRRELHILMYDQTFAREAEAVFLNLKDLRWLMSCEGYRQYLVSAARSGFGVTFYVDGVLLAQKGMGDAGQLQHLLDNWPGCE